jgi:sigma-B regulation protein RsbU (phosphoserine phosphatase)
MHLTIRWKLILSISIPLLLTYAGLLGWDYYRQRSSALLQMQALVSERAQSEAGHLDARLSAVMEAGDSIAAVLANRPGITTAQLRALLTAHFRRDPWIVQSDIVLNRQVGPGESSAGAPIAVSARHVFGSQPKLTDLPDPDDVTKHPWLGQARRGQSGWSSPHAEPGITRLVCTYAVPVMVGQTFEGAVALSVAADPWTSRARADRADRADRPARLAQAPAPDSSGHDPARESVRHEASPRETAAERAPATDAAPDLRPRIPAPEGTAILDAEGRVIASNMPHRRRAEDLPEPTLFALAEKYDKQELADVAHAAVEGRGGVLRVAGLSDVIPGLEPDRYHWIAFAPIPATGWILASAISESSVMDPILDRLLMRAGFLAAGMVILLLVVMLVSIRISRPLERLAGAVDRLADGDLDAHVGHVRGGDELARLARGFNHMTAQLKSHISALTEQTARREKVESEMRIARQIQTDLLPRKFPPFPDRTEFQLHATNVPAEMVAGDFYDFFFTTPAVLTLVIADVSGHGVPAALLMAVTRTIIRNLAQAGLCPAEIVERTNTMLLADVSAGMFVTLFLAQYEPASGRVRYVNAGHPTPLRVRADEWVERFGDVSSPLLGVAPSCEIGGFQQGESQLNIGESLLMYTDGVTEARSDGSGEMLGEAGLSKMLRKRAELSPEALCREIAQGVDAYQQHRRADDVTLLVLRRTTAGR